ncbi:MAG TPA: ribosome biogenesis factor YjgA [Steroidobacteraceae bacterium]|jgi:ribosome-associated protein|nr:ribosome biogenesis factor YjgA [Steroidobacteraceae bacterium]
MTRDIESETDEEPAGRRSKSDRKREADWLQNLGVELAALPTADLEALELPEKLLGALLELRRLTSHGAQVRQRQYIGKLMRQIDPEPLHARMEARKRRHDGEIRRFQRIERWRDRLLEEPSALTELLEEHPLADRKALTRLLAKAGFEREQGRAPAASRELFAYLRGLLG